MRSFRNEHCRIRITRRTRRRKQALGNQQQGAPNFHSEIFFVRAPHDDVLDPIGKRNSLVASQNNPQSAACYKVVLIFIQTIRTLDPRQELIKAADMLHIESVEERDEFISRGMEYLGFGD